MELHTVFASAHKAYRRRGSRLSFRRVDNMYFSSSLGRQGSMCSALKQTSKNMVLKSSELWNGQSGKTKPTQPNPGMDCAHVIQNCLQCSNISENRKGHTCKSFLKEIFVWDVFCHVDAADVTQAPTLESECLFSMRLSRC